MKPDTIIIISPGFPENESDDTCLPSIQLFTRLLKVNYPSLNVIVLALQYPFTPGEYDWYRCRVIALGGKGRSKLFRLMLWRRARKKLEQLHKENNIRGILSLWCGEAAWLGSRFARRHDLPHQCWIQGQDAKKDNKYVRRLKPLPAELVAISDFVQEEFERNHQLKPAQVIPIGIDPHEFPIENNKRDIDILGAGSLIPLKQYDIFIEIIAELKTFYPGIQAMICGKGPELERLQKLISQNHLHKNITLAGEIGHPELLRVMQRSGLFLHPSDYEGFGAVCIEALYAGCPVVSFCKPMKEVIPQWHVVQNRPGMVMRIMEILNDKKNIHTRVLPYTMQSSVIKMMRLFGY